MLDARSGESWLYLSGKIRAETPDREDVFFLSLPKLWVAIDGDNAPVSEDQDNLRASLAVSSVSGQFSIENGAASIFDDDGLYFDDLQSEAPAADAAPIEISAAEILEADSPADEPASEQPVIEAFEVGSPGDAAHQFGDMLPQPIYSNLPEAITLPELVAI
ncbi:MAG: hypothetical protein ABR601_11100 [Parasphingopyxis sp.]|nr:hypothetical protein [Sphingomonadales bacterium]